MLFRIFNVLVVVQVSQRFRRAVNNVADCQSLAQHSVVIAHVVDDKDSFSITIVRSDEATRLAEALGRKFVNQLRRSHCARVSDVDVYSVAAGSQRPTVRRPRSDFAVL